MSEAKHTKGPWRFQEWMHSDEELAEIRKHEAAGLPVHPVACVFNNGERVIMGPAGRVALVDCQTPFKRGKGHETECAERDANARLIAAAPDLLAACQDALAAGNDGDWQSAEKVLRAAVSRSLDDAQTGNEQPKGGA
jgi:hypothetical protein